MVTSGDPSAPFAFLMDASMLGVGVGFDTKVSNDDDDDDGDDGGGGSSSR